MKQNKIKKIKNKCYLGTALILFGLILIIVAIVISATSCGVTGDDEGSSIGWNKQLFDFNNSFEYVHVYSTEQCYKIKQWNDYENSDQLQVVLIDGTVVLLHSADCALIHGTCPFCKGKGH